MSVRGLAGFLSGRWKHRARAAVLLRRADSAVLLVRPPGGAWSLPGGPVRAASTPRATAAEALRSLALDAEVGRLLVQDFRSGPEHGEQEQVYDGGAWDTDVEDFSAAGGEVEAWFCPAGRLLRKLGDGPAERAAAALRALELGLVIELEDGRHVTPRSGEVGNVPVRTLMPELPEASSILG